MTDAPTPSPDPNAEQEVDIGRLARRVLAHWWLPAGGLILGLAVGYMLSLGGAQVYRAEALVSLGTPFTVQGTPLAGLVANPRAITEIINSESAQRKAEAVAHLKIGALRGKVSSRAVSSGVPGKSQGPQLIGISVKGNRPRKVELATNRLATIAIARTAPFVDQQIQIYESQLATQAQQLASLGTRIDALQKEVNAPGLAALDRLVLVSYLDNAEQRRGALLDAQSSLQQSLTLAKQVERPSILQSAAAVKTSARSQHNSMAVSGAIGLILGVLAALLWDWGSPRMNRHPAV
jgi:hypothetical protein